MISLRASSHCELPEDRTLLKTPCTHLHTGRGRPAEPATNIGSDRLQARLVSSDSNFETSCNSANALTRFSSGVAQARSRSPGLRGGRGDQSSRLRPPGYGEPADKANK